MIRLAALLLFAALAVPLAAQGADPIDERRFTCPVGGKAFRQEVGYAAFPLITLPDGSWLGDPMMDVQIPVCPDNGLVILPDYAGMEGQDAMAYGAYSATEIARLPALIADPAYRALAADNRHAQAWWLATQLGRPASLRFHLLQRSSWATTDPALRQRRVAAFAADAPALIEAMDEPAAAKQAHLFHVVNALRELGRFDAALALLDTIEADGPVPGIASPDDMFAPEAAGPQMRAVIAAGDDDRYPVELLDRRLANDKCSGGVEYPPYDQRTPKTEAACARRRAAADAEEAVYEEAAALGDDPEKRDRLCAGTPADKRGAGLRQACDDAQTERDRIAGDALAIRGETLAPQCDATPENERKGALLHGCAAYDMLVEAQLGKLLMDDAAGFSVMCGKELAYIPDRDRRVFRGCELTEAGMLWREVERLRQDPVALEARCKSIDENEHYSALTEACSGFHAERLSARIEELSNNDPAYEHECARFGGKARDLSIETVDETELACDVARYRRSHASDPAIERDIADGGISIDLPGGDVYKPDHPTAATASLATDGALDRKTYLDDDSELGLAARNAAIAMIAKAKAENTYPHRPEGQRD